MILPPLHDLIVEIMQDDIKGGQLLNLLHKRCHCGVPELQSCIQRYDYDFSNHLLQLHLFSILNHYPCC